jgi:rhodanese-related sulfurtransferase
MALSEQTPFEITHISPNDLHAQLQEGEDVTLLDVRMAWDHEAQHPAGSISLPLNELPYRLEELDPKKRYVLSCYHGYSSQDGVAFLMGRGFERVENLAGGFSGWALAGLPVEGKYAE